MISESWKDDNDSVEIREGGICSRLDVAEAGVAGVDATASWEAALERWRQVSACSKKQGTHECSASQFRRP